MDAKQNLYKIQMECFEVQNPEDFDVAFEIDGQKLYADKSRLTKLSPTFKSMLSDRWTSKDETLKIETFGYENFKEFLTFIYSGECSLNDKNISNMFDIAEYYGVKVFKKDCDKYLSNIEYNSENVFEFCELSDKYSLTEMKESLNIYISKNFGSFIKSECFKKLSKSVMKNIVASNQNALRWEEFFEAAEFQALKKKELDENLNLQETIKEELSDFLPFFKFDQISIDFLIKFVVKESSFLFSPAELSEILWVARCNVCVKITDGNGKIMKGVLNCNETGKISDVIASQKGEPLIADYYWQTRQPEPNVPSKLIKKDGIEWYLFYDSFGDLCVRRQSKVDDGDYLLAELFTEGEFILNEKCRIEVNRFA
uniref:BTB domain-containing protein n=1 Tax=Panagrolaimus davidi TaxID=227884 RepID=A0A914PQQ3_9BILA